MPIIIYSSSFCNASIFNNTVKRGTVLRATTGQHAGEQYLLVRETDVAYSKDAAGNNVGEPRGLYNLVNLTTGKTRVSDPQRKLIAHPENGPSLDQINRHFGNTYEVVGNINDVRNPQRVYVLQGTMANVMCL